MAAERDRPAQPLSGRVDDLQVRPLSAGVAREDRERAVPGMEGEPGDAASAWYSPIRSRVWVSKRITSPLLSPTASVRPSGLSASAESSPPSPFRTPSAAGLRSERREQAGAGRDRVVEGDARVGEASAWSRRSSVRAWAPRRWASRRWPRRARPGARRARSPRRRRRRRAARRPRRAASAGGGRRAAGARPRARSPPGSRRGRRARARSARGRARRPSRAPRPAGRRGRARRDRARSLATRAAAPIRWW